ncbi:MAG: hypothetical protein E4H22_00140 [Solirubrobacterales bacterium]|nr:MAG: hypothetical protein E4H22_00140 [Solirubrobacterales bacterium]
MITISAAIAWLDRPSANTEQAVRDGTVGTAGTVTSAAVVMVAVFAIFATLSTIDMKEMGVGLAVAILIERGGARGSASMRP